MPTPPIWPTRFEPTTTEPAAAEAPRDIGALSLPLRTTLHHDSTLEAPFDRLVAIYREAGRMAELIELYRTHIQTYPADPNGAAVLVRLLEAGRKITASERLEKQTLELLDRLRDEPARRAYLAERTKATPERIDLLSLYVKSLLLGGDRFEGRKQIARLVADAPKRERRNSSLRSRSKWRIRCGSASPTASRFRSTPPGNCCARRCPRSGSVGPSIFRRGGRSSRSIGSRQSDCSSSTCRAC